MTSVSIKPMKLMFPNGSRGEINHEDPKIEEYIRKLAYAFWEQAGSPESDGKEFWKKAVDEWYDTHDRILIGEEERAGDPR